MSERSIKVGVIAEQTGVLSFMGIADANVAKMVIDEINAVGGLLDRRLSIAWTIAKPSRALRRVARMWFSTRSFHLTAAACTCR
jgi:ABC-type branched-subunit amino acid transport system substrate-binding protein